MGEEGREDGLWVYGGADAEGGLTVVCWVVFDCECGEGGLVCFDEICVPDLFGGPKACEVGTDEHRAVEDAGVFSEGVYELAEIADVVRWTITLRWFRWG